MHWTDVITAVRKLTDGWPDQGDSWHRGLLHLPLPTNADRLALGAWWLIVMLVLGLAVALPEWAERRERR